MIDPACPTPYSVAVAAEATALGQRSVPAYFQQDFVERVRYSVGNGLLRSQHPEIIGQAEYEIRGEQFSGTGEVGEERVKLPLGGLEKTILGIHFLLA